MGLEQVRLLEFPKISDPRGSLSFVEGERHLPFAIKRVFYLYGIAPGQSRGGHAHKWHDEVIIPLAGSFDIILDDGFAKQPHHLDQPHVGLFLPRLVWQDLVNFSPGAVCLVLASDVYSEADYYRRYPEFLAAVRGSGSKLPTNQR
ncbi:MAG: FdtA/QdtA family cupin domain-containing protein [Lentisphaeria bacterium]|jgi:dTDP-4-dehydrorhamnose 3,5-epimerase-like enzyme